MFKKKKEHLIKPDAERIKNFNDMDFVNSDEIDFSFDLFEKFSRSGS